ncbi:unnamed protein product, partial [Polarella glacialis]
DLSVFRVTARALGFLGEGAAPHAGSLPDLRGAAALRSEAMWLQLEQRCSTPAAQSFAAVQMKRYQLHQNDHREQWEHRQQHFHFQRQRSPGDALHLNRQSQAAISISNGYVLVSDMEVPCFNIRNFQEASQDPQTTAPLHRTTFRMCLGTDRVLTARTCLAP